MKPGLINRATKLIERVEDELGLPGRRKTLQVVVFGGADAAEHQAAALAAHLQTSPQDPNDIHAYDWIVRRVLWRACTMPRHDQPRGEMPPEPPIERKRYWLLSRGSPGVEATPPLPPRPVHLPESGYA